MVKRVIFASLIGFLSLAQAAPILQVVTEDWPPFNYVLPDGQIGGISSQKVKQVLAQANISYEIAVHPWNAAYEIAKNGRNVMIYSIIRSKAREAQFKWICPLTQPVTLFFFGLTDRKDLNVRTSDDVKRYTIGVTSSEFTQHYLQSARASNDSMIKISPDNNTNLSKLLDGTVDIVVETVPSIKLRLERLGKSYDLVRPLVEVRTDDVAPTCMAFGLNTDDGLVERVRQSLLKINAASE